MVARCTKSNHPDYKHYGGRGITVCDSWLQYTNFENDMYEEYGYKLEEFGKHNMRKNCTLDRIDNSKGYSKENCRWITLQAQQANRRIPSHAILINGKTLKEHIKIIGGNYGTVMCRLHKSKLTLEQAINLPLQKGGRFKTE